MKTTELCSEMEEMLDWVGECFYDRYHMSMMYTARVKKALLKHVQKYGYEEVKNAVKIACNQYDDPNVAFGMIGGILYNRNQEWDIFR